MARRPSEVPPAVVKELNAGTRESANLAESLAIDLAKLLKAAASELPSKTHAAMRAAAGEGYIKRITLGAKLALDELGPDVVGRFEAHKSDTVRGWAAFQVGMLPRLKLAGRLKRIEPLADDPHFGVREWAWLGVRDHIVAEPLKAIELLTPWVTHTSANVRRFATEATRPRGVWCAHIRLLRDEPEHALPLLEPLKADTEKYVQDSVANWLNDAAKTQPAFVIDLTDRWLSENESRATARICKRARRSL